MSSAEPWTVGRLLQWTADYLKAHGSDSPRLDAEVLLAEALGCQRIELYTPSMRRRARSVGRRFASWSAAGPKGTPVAYLVGRREFYSLSFRVTPDVLIPRPETELLVVAVLDLAKGRGVGVRGRASESGSQRINNPQSPIRHRRRRHGQRHHRRLPGETPAGVPRDGHRPQPGGPGRGPRQCEAARRGRADRVRRKRSVGGRAGGSAIRLHREQSAVRRRGRVRAAWRPTCGSSSRAGAGGRAAGHRGDRAADSAGGRASAAGRALC